MPLELNEVIPWGRSFSEYVRIFSLTEKDFKKKILGCSDGPASFNAEAKEGGIKVISCDPLYRYSAQEINKRIDETMLVMLQRIAQNKSDYIWNSFKSIETWKKHRILTMKKFIIDYENDIMKERYINAGLPNLPFSSGDFDLSLMAHFLFLYTENLSFEFHLNSIRELIRVASEVRIFPLIKNSGGLSPYVYPVISEFRREGYQVIIKKVQYHFLIGANEMLVISKNAPYNFECTKHLSITYGKSHETT